MKFFSSRTAFLFAFCSILLVASGLMLFRLGAAPLWDYDEASYAQITHNMLAHGAWVSQQYFTGPFLEKPPLYEWLAAGGGLVFGESEFTLRLPSALAGIALVGATVLLVLAMTGNMLAALAAGGVLLATSPVVETARQMRIDVLVTLWIVLAALAAVWAMRDKRYFLLFGVALALAVMTKSVIAFFAFAALPFVLGWFGQWRLVRTKELWLGLGLAALVALPWHIIEFLRYGKQFWHEYVVFSVTSRIQEDLFGLRQTTNGDYLWYLVHFAAPWTQVFLFAALPLALWWRRIELRMRAGVGLSVSMVALVIVVFFASATKAPTYLLPLYPFAAAALGMFFAVCLERTHGARRRVVWVVGVVLWCVGMGITVYNGFHLNRAYYGKADELALEEHTLAPTLAQHARDRWLVFGGDRELGSLMYYSGRTDPQVLTGTTTLEVGDMILMYQTKHEAFFEQFPVSTSALFSGQQLLLLEVVSED